MVQGFLVFILDAIAKNYKLNWIQRRSLKSTKSDEKVDVYVPDQIQRYLENTLKAVWKLYNG